MTPAPLPLMTALAVLIPFAGGYFLSYLLRVVNAVIAPNLTADLGLTAANLGFLTSLSFFALATFQMPLGILLDKYGPRQVNAVLIAIAGLGTLVFAVGQDFLQLSIGRALMGLGTSAALMAAITAFRHFFPAERLPLLTGLHMTAGGLGALAATSPIEWAMTFTDWRGVFLGLSIFAAFIAVAIWVVVPRSGLRHEPESLGQAMRGTASIFTNRLFIAIAPLTVISQASFMGIQSLWTGPWLQDVAGLDRADTADVLFAIAFAMVLGFAATGVVAEVTRKIGISLMTTALACMGIFAVSLAIIAAGFADDQPYLWVLFGFWGGFGILPYSIASAAFPASMAGRVVTSLNVLVFFGAFAVQWGVGVVIDVYSPGQETGLDPKGFEAAFLSIVALKVASLIWYLIAKPQPDVVR